MKERLLIRPSLGAARPAAARTEVSVEYPYGKSPFATFIFKYRSRHDLQVEGIIPRSPSPVPLEERDPDSLSAEEARELVRRMREREQDMAKVKREKRGHSPTVIRDMEAGEDDDDVIVEAEGHQRKRNRPSTDSGVDIVDLTDL
ncbi:hypothetical protein LTR86_004499 [Recurvomyces mirabilis]|nr:hypothetical protein LTR86_004499 [Recurvomyces mirabilis]